MHKPTLLLLPLASLFFASCGKKDADYDIPNPGYDEAATSIPAPAAPTYGAAAYEENTAVPVPAVDPASVATVPTGVAKEHYVAPGDSLWKLSKQYCVSIDAIKAANGMTTDTVVLGKKMIIPAP